jgi:hypothetical protein
MYLKEIIPKFSLFALFLILLNIITILLGDSKSRLTVINRTNHYIHIKVQNTIYPYVAPDWDITHESKIVATMRVKIFYSPGQGMENSVIDTIIGLPYTPAYTSVSSQGCDCQDDQYDCEKITETEHEAEGGSSILEVTQADFD